MHDVLHCPHRQECRDHVISKNKLVTTYSGYDPCMARPTWWGGPGPHKDMTSIGHALKNNPDRLYVLYWTLISISFAGDICLGRLYVIQQPTRISGYKQTCLLFTKAKNIHTDRLTVQNADRKGSIDRMTHGKTGRQTDRQRGKNSPNRQTDIQTF